MPNRIASAERRLINEINEVAELSGLQQLHVNEESVLEEDDHEIRKIILGLLKDRVITSGVIFAYVFIDEMINEAIFSKHYPEIRRSSLKTDSLKIMLEKIYLLQKLQILQKIYDVPKYVTKHITNLNDLRNSLAHSFIPEQRLTGKPIYKGRSIYNITTYRNFEEDQDRVGQYFMILNYRMKPEDFKT